MNTGIKKYLKLLLFAGITAVLILGTYLYSVSVQKSISEKVIRLHVIANSDSREDQAVKLLVRDEILKSMKYELSEAENKDEALKIIRMKLPKIESISKNVVKSKGLDYPIRISIAKEDFPLKYYGAFCFPAGNYTALKISIGEGKGKNWWCVMFPPLCFTEEALTDEGYEVLQSALSEKDMEIVDRTENRKKPAYNIKFFVVEKWQELLQ